MRVMRVFYSLFSFVFLNYSRGTGTDRQVEATNFDQVLRKSKGCIFHHFDFRWNNANAQMNLINSLWQTCIDRINDCETIVWHIVDVNSVYCDRKIIEASFHGTWFSSQRAHVCIHLIANLFVARTGYSDYLAHRWTLIVTRNLFDTLSLRQG